MILLLENSAGSEFFFYKQQYRQQLVGVAHLPSSHPKHFNRQTDVVNNVEFPLQLSRVRTSDDEIPGWQIEEANTILEGSLPKGTTPIDTCRTKRG